MSTIIKISSSTDWIITGDAWITNVPLSGSGDYEFEPILADNATGEFRVGEIVVDYGSYGIEVIPILQYANNNYINAKIFILGLDEDEGQLVHFEVLVNGATYNSAVCACGSFEDVSGFPETGIVPVDGAEVSVRAFAEGYTNMSKQFAPTMNNNIYWLSSTTEYDNALDVLADGGVAAVSTAYSGGTLSWDGDFTYNYTGNYFYIVFDYRNRLDCGGSGISLTANGSYYPINLTVDYSDLIGVGSISFTSSYAITALVTYNDSVVGEGTTSGTYKFVKPLTDPSTVLATFSNGEDEWNGTLSLTTICVSLTSTQISDAGYTTSALACAARTTLPTLNRYHNGASTYPIVGDVIYASSDGSLILNGDNKYWYLYGYAYSFLIDTNGVVQSIAGCVCSEVAAPVITATTFYIEVDSTSAIKLTATNNPTSWAIVSNNSYYTIDGGLRGGKIAYTDEFGSVLSQTVGINEVVTIVASTGSVSTTYGTATSTLAGTYYQYGILIDSDGNLSGDFSKEGYYTISVNATNCFGTSSNATINIKVKHLPKLHQFAMDDSGMDSSIAACALTSCDTNFWFSTGLTEADTGRDPAINDFVFIDPYGEQYFNGGYLYYKTSLNNYLLIDGIGQVVDKSTC